MTSAMANAISKRGDLKNPKYHVLDLCLDSWDYMSAQSM